MAEKEYIELKGAAEKLRSLGQDYREDGMFGLMDVANQCAYIIEAEPRADVEPVRHGYWIRPFPTTTKSYSYICSLCGMTNYFIGNAVGKSCSHCMAKMDGRADNGC